MEEGCWGCIWRRGDVGFTSLLGAWHPHLPRAPGGPSVQVQRLSQPALWGRWFLAHALLLLSSALRWVGRGVSGRPGGSLLKSPGRVLKTPFGPWAACTSLAMHVSVEGPGGDLLESPSWGRLLTWSPDDVCEEGGREAGASCWGTEMDATPPPPPGHVCTA